MGTPVPASDLPENIKYVPPEDLPPPSVMNPNDPGVLKRIGNTLADPKKTVPMAVGAATAAAPLIPGVSEMSLPARLGIAAIGGFAQPYTSAAASKAMGGNPETPSVWDALRSAGMNMAFEGMAAKAPREIQGARDVSKLPAEQQTFAQLKQQILNTDFLKKSGFSDAQIAEIRKDPETAARQLQRSINQGNQVADTFKSAVDNERAIFKKRYDDALSIPEGPSSRTTTTINGKTVVSETGGARASLGTAPVDNKAIAAQMRAVAGGQSQHELTPAFQKFLLRKADEIDPPAAEVTDPLSIGGKKLDPKRPGDAKLIETMKAKGLLSQPETKPFTVQDARDLNTELHESAPSGQAATNLDKKTIATLDNQIRGQYENAMRGKGATEEQISQLQGIDKDWGMFQATIGKLRPNRADFGEQTADAFFQTAKQNPTLALNFVRMADDAGKLPEFRDAFMKQIGQEMRGAGGGPINQMEALQKLQTAWRGTDDGKAVLTAVFGKDSPLANPVEMSKFLGAANQPATQDALSQAGRSMSRIGFTGRQLLMLGALGGSVYRLKDHPEEIPAAIAALGTLAVAGPVLTRLSSNGQRAMIGMLAKPNPETVQTFFRVAGPALTAGFNQPSDLATETPRP